MSNSATSAGRHPRFLTIAVVLLVLLASLLASLRMARDRPAPAQDVVARDAAASREEARRARVRQVFVEVKGRDPIGWDEGSLRRWAHSPLGIREIAARMRAERPLVGVYYFTWYRDEDGEWRNDATAVSTGAPLPVLGQYDSSDPQVMDTHISQMTAAGFDFVIINVITELPDSWARAARFFDRLRGRRLKAAVMLDGLYDKRAFEKDIWTRKAAQDFANHPNYFMLHGRPLVMLFSAPVDFTALDLTLRNVYWAPQYTPEENAFNPGGVLHPHDWPFWAPTPQPVMNGIVPIMPGYVDTHLERERRMEFPRRDGQTYHDQWQRALALRPELIVVYSWNEHFEQTAIEPTDAWGDRYVKWTACYAAHAHQGRTGTCP